MGDTRDPETDQDLPIPNGRRPILKIIMEDDLPRRRLHGVMKYGQELQAFNGRDPVLDAYEEATDLMVYLKQLLEENAALVHYTFGYDSDVWCSRCELTVFEAFTAGVDAGVVAMLEEVRRHERESHSNG